MTNGDRIRTFSDELLALTIMCPVEACLTEEDEPITIMKDNDKCPSNCSKCIYEWLQQEELK